MHLRLAAQEGQVIPLPRKKPHPYGLALTPLEVQHLRAAIRNAAKLYGSMEKLGALIGAAVSSLRHATSRKGDRPSAGLAVAIARVSGTTVEAILAGKLVPAGTCPTCGATPPQRRTAGGAP